MVNIILSVLAILLISLSSCDNEKLDKSLDIISIDNHIYPLHFIKDKEYKFSVISKVPPIISNLEDKEELLIYFLINENKDCEILRMTSDFIVRNRFIIKYGVGPGEALNPRIYGGDHKAVIVYDAPSYKFIKYDYDFKLIDEYRVKDLGTILYSGSRYVPKYKFVLDGFDKFINYYETTYSIYIRKFISNKTIKDKKIYMTPVCKNALKENKKMLLVRPIHFGFFYDHIYILDKNDYRIIKMDIEGNILINKKIRYKAQYIPEQLRKKWIEKFYRDPKYTEKFDYPEKLLPACWIIAIKGGIAVGRCENYDIDDKNTITADYYDSNLNYLGKISLPYFFAWNQPSAGQDSLNRCIFSRDDKLFSIEERDEENWIIRWSIKVEKNEIKTLCSKS